MKAKPVNFKMKTKKMASKTLTFNIMLWTLNKDQFELLLSEFYGRVVSIGDQKPSSWKWELVFDDCEVPANDLGSKPYYLSGLQNAAEFVNYLEVSFKKEGGKEKKSSRKKKIE